MSDLPRCRWRGEPYPSGDYRCSCPSLKVSPLGVPADLCRRCPYADRTKEEGPRGFGQQKSRLRQFTERAARFARALARHARDWFRKVSRAEQQRRLAICESNRCGHYQDGGCLKCGCKLKGRVLGKTAWKSEKCPAGMW